VSTRRISVQLNKNSTRLEQDNQQLRVRAQAAEQQNVTLQAQLKEAQNARSEVGSELEVFSKS